MIKFEKATILLLIAVSVSKCDLKTNSDKKTSHPKEQDLNYAQELMNIAEKEGLNLTMRDVNDAASASSDHELEESFPLPVAQKFIGHRRRDNMDTLREQMIGLIFTGEPKPLKPRRRRPIRRNYRQRPPPRQQPRFDERGDMPREILKPIAFIPEASNVEFPVPHLVPSESDARNAYRPAPNRPPRRRRPVDSFKPRNPHTRRPPGSRKETRNRPNDFFSNTVGKDFGPVTYETFGGNPNPPTTSFVHHGGRPQSRPKPKLPSRPPPKDLPASGFSSTHFGFPDNPSFGSKSPIKPFKKVNLGQSGQPHNGRCQRYTDDICLDAENYPHEEILSSLSNDPRRTGSLMAEVKDQSADSLVDGITAAQEKQYDFTHYYGANRRQDSGNQIHRDFADDGGYLCPSEVKYARPKRARNSKGNWKFIVNMDKYTQTIRMEKCMKPGGTCSYVSHHYYATCNQIYNYQRLLSWEKGKGLHMDIFKVPSCCSCHIQGYAYVFPPLHKNRRIDTDIAASQPIPPASKTLNDINEQAPPYSPINYPNIKVGPETAPPRRPAVTSGRSEPSNTRSRTKSPAIRRSDVERINYGYHPIIDFFQ